MVPVQLIVLDGIFVVNSQIFMPILKGSRVFDIPALKYWQ